MTRYVIVGCSAAGVAAVKKIHELDPQAEIICIDAQREIPYNRCLLIDYCAEIKNRDQLSIVSRDILEQKNIHWLFGLRVESIDAGARNLRLSDGQLLSYDKLFIATGSSAKKLNIPGVESRGVFYFHTLDDANRIIQFMGARRVEKAVVIGSGLTGLEVADFVSSTGVGVTVIEKASAIMPSLLDNTSAHYLEELLFKKGIHCIFESVAQEVLEKNGHVKGMRLSDGTTVPADLVISACGVRPNALCCSDVTLESRDGHIMVNKFMETSQTSIYAGGDVAIVPGLLDNGHQASRLWSDAVQQGFIAGASMVGESTNYPGLLTIWSTRIAGTPIIGCGPVACPDGNAILNRGSEHYHRFTLENNQLKGFVMMGKPHKLGFLRQALITGRPIDSKDLSF